MIARRLITLITLWSITLVAFAQKEEARVSHFTWGADIGGGIDMTCSNNSTVDIDACLGFRNSFIHFLGVGAGVNMMISNSDRQIPVYLQLRTNFCRRKTLCFFDGRIGASLSYLKMNQQQTALYGSAGIGFNLARSRNFSSHIILSYTFVDRGYFIIDETVYPQKDIQQATLRLGLAF